VEKSIARTTRWLIRCKEEMERLNALEGTLNKKQMLFGINQGSTYEDLRVRHMEEIAALDLDGYAIGGLAVGESNQDMYRIVDITEPHMPENKARYLMGVGTPVNLIEAVYRGIDMFDCVMPSRNARHGTLFTWEGVRIIGNAAYQRDARPIDENCGCPVCKNHSRAYLRHLLNYHEILGYRLAVQHNMHFYNSLMARIREEIRSGDFERFRAQMVPILNQRI